MKRGMLVLVGMVCGVMSIGGCGDAQAKQERESSRRFEQAIETIRQANRGFVDAGDATGDVQAYRQKMLVKAATELEGAMAGASATQQVAGQRLLAMAYLANARAIQQQAMVKWEGMSEKTSQVVMSAARVRMADFRASNLTSDESQGVSYLKNYKAELAGQQPGLAREGEDLRGQLVGLQEQHDRLIQEADASAQQARLKNEEAFTLQGQARLQGYMTSLAAERQSQMLGAQAEQIRLQMNVREAALGMIRQRQEGLKAAIGALEGQAQAASQRQKEMDQLQQVAIDGNNNPVSLKAQAMELEQAWVETDKAFSEDVMVLWTQSLEQADKALAALAKAKSQARDGNDRQGVALDLLAAQAVKGELLGGQAAVLGTLVRCYQTASQAVEVLKGSQSGVKVSERVGALVTQQQQMIEAGKELIAQGTEMAGELASGSGAELAGVQNGRLQTVGQMLEASRVMVQ